MRRRRLPGPKCVDPGRRCSADFQAISGREVSGEVNHCGRALFERFRQSVGSCIEEKSPIQALDRTQPGLALKKGAAERCRKTGPDKHPLVQAWLKRNPRFVPHFIPTSSSFVESRGTMFGELASKLIRRGVFHSVPDLIGAIEEFRDKWNRDPKPFVWTATVESIAERLQGCRQTLARIQPGIASPRLRKKHAKSRGK